MCLADTFLSVALLLGLPAGICSVSGHSAAVQSLPIVGIVAEHCWYNRESDYWRQLRAVLYRQS